MKPLARFLIPEAALATSDLQEIGCPKLTSHRTASDNDLNIIPLEHVTCLYLEAYIRSLSTIIRFFLHSDILCLVLSECTLPVWDNDSFPLVESERSFPRLDRDILNRVSIDTECPTIDSALLRLVSSACFLPTILSKND